MFTIKQSSSENPEFLNFLSLIIYGDPRICMIIFFLFIFRPKRSTMPALPISHLDTRERVMSILFEQYYRDWKVKTSSACEVSYWLKHEKLVEGMTMRRKESNVLCQCNVFSKVNLL